MAGLDLSSKGDGNLTLGANQPVDPSQVNPMAAQLPDDVIDFQNNPLQSGLLALGSITSTMGGFDNPLLRAREELKQKKQNQLQQSQLDRENSMKAMQLGTNLVKGAANMKGDQRTKYFAASKAAVDKFNSPEASNLFEAMMDSPERAEVVLGGLLDKSELVKQINATDPSGKALMEFLISPAGIKHQEDLSDQYTKPVAMKKINNITNSLDKLVRDGNINQTLLDRVQKDGKITITEIQELNDSIPDGHELKLTSGELGSVSATRNHEGLRAVGISLAEDFKPEEITGSGKTVFGPDGEIVGTLVTSKTGGNLVQPPGGGANRPFNEGEYVSTVSDSSEGAGLSKKTAGTLEGTLIASTATLDNLDAQVRDFDRQFLTVGGRVKAAALSSASKLGIPLDNDSKEFLKSIAQFQAGTLVTLNEEIKRITGAAVTKSEANDRIIPSMPNKDDAPDVYMAKMETVRERLQVVKLRTQMALTQGLKIATDIPWQTVVNQIEDGSLPQKRMDALLEEGMSAQDAFTKVESEFPKSMLDKAMGNL